MMLPLSLSLVLRKINKFSICLCLTYFSNFKALVSLSIHMENSFLHLIGLVASLVHIGKSLTKYQVWILPISGLGTCSMGEGKRGNTLLVLPWLCKLPQSYLQHIQLIKINSE